MQNKHLLNHVKPGGRIFSVLVTLLVTAMTLLPQSVWGQTEYGLTVGGVVVTSENAESITGGNIDGSVSFDPSTNTLTLNDATISGTTISNGCIVSGLSSLNIVLKGNNTLDCRQDSCTAIRSVANAALTITKGEDECSLGFYGSRAIRDFKSVTLSGMVWDRTCAYQLATINNNGEHTGMMLYDTAAEEEIGEINLLDVENLPHPSMYAYYDPEQTATLFGFEADPSWEIRYSIDYVDESLEDVTNELYDMQQDENGVPLQGAATVTAWTVFGNATSDVVKGKLFELSETSLSTVNGAAPLSAPTLRPAIEPEDGISVSYTGTEPSDVATIDPTTGEVTILGLGNESFSVNIVIAQENRCTVLNKESLPFEVNVLNSYPLYIGDTQVTEINAEDVLGDGTVSFMKSEGQVAAATYTLTLNGAAITGPVKVGLSNLTFDIHGTNTITTDETCIQNVAGSESMPSLTFKSTSDEVGSLTLTNNNGRISEIGQNNISVSNELAVFLTVNDTEDFTSNLYYMTDGSTTVAKFVPSYGVQVGEMQVYAGNAADVLGDGTISFNKETNTLTLNGANTGALCTSLEELTVELVGDNTLSEEGSYPVLRSLSGENVTVKIQSTAAVKGTLTMNMPYTQAGNFCEDQVTLNIVAPMEVVSGNLTGNDDNKNTVVIGPNYGITITSAGSSYPITSDNRLDVLGDGGSVQFDGKNTLILNDAWVSSVILGADDSWVKKGLTIYLKGDVNNIGEQEQDGLIYQGQGANVPLTFATGDVEPGTLTLSYSDQPLVGFTPTYLYNLIDKLDVDNHIINIAPGLDPVVDESGEEANLDGDGSGLGTVLEGHETATQVITADKKMLLTLGDDDGFFSWTPSTTGDNAELWDGEESAKLVVLSTEQNGVPEDKEPTTSEFATGFKGVTMAIPAGSYEVACDYKNTGNGQLVVQVGRGTDALHFYMPPRATHDRSSIQFATQRPVDVFLYNRIPEGFSRFRAPGRKMANTTTLKSVKVSARSVAATPPPVLMPKVLTKDDVAAAKSGNHITITDTDVTDYADNAFEGQTGITYVDLSATSITGKIIDRTKLPDDATVFLPASNDDNSAKNIVIAGVCNNLQLNDAVDFEIPSDFTAVKASLSRDFTSDLGKNCTVCVPFALDNTQTAELGTFYTLSAHSENTITMESVDATEANKAYMFKPAKETFSAEMVDVKKAAPVRTTVSPLSFLGTYQQITGLNSTADFVYYCFMQTGEQAGKFVKITSDVIVNPFRAYMELPASESLARVLDLDFGDGTTGINRIDNVKLANDVYYDLQGRRVLYPKKGLYILNGKKVIIK